ncbi:MAG: hypothetical protein WAO98_09220 [Alphaproteobacteria bacterium]
MFGAIDPSWSHQFAVSDHQAIWSAGDFETNTAYGVFSLTHLMCVEEISDAEEVHIEPVALAYIKNDDTKPFLLRTQLGCAFGTIFSSTDCDCGLQRDAAMKEIAAQGSGAFIYFPEREGQGVGFFNKMRLMAHERLTGTDVFAAAADLNIALDPDSCLKWVPPIVHEVLGIKSPIVLLTGNPQRQKILMQFGLQGVQACRSLFVEESFLSPDGRREVRAKAARYDQSPKN